MALSPELLQRLDLPICPLCGSTTQAAPPRIAKEFRAMGAEGVRRCISPTCPWWVGVVHGVFVERKSRDTRTEVAA